jgi:transposase
MPSSVYRKRIRGLKATHSPSSDIVRIKLMQACFGIPNRVAKGFLRLFVENLGISFEFSYRTIERGYDPERAKKNFGEILRIINEASNPIEKIISTDETFAT